MGDAEQRNKPRQSHVPQAYGRELVAALMRTRRPGETKEEAGERAGIPKPTLWRLEKGEGSYKAARHLARYLEEHGVTVPPPQIDVRDAEDYQWIEMGRRLREEFFDDYQFVLAHVARILASKRDLDDVKKSLIPGTKQ